MEWRQWGGALREAKSVFTSSYCNLVFLFALSLALCVAGGVYMKKQAMKKQRRPPGPRGLPIIGHLHLLGKYPHRALYNLSKVHGPLMWLRFGSVTVIAASTPQAARIILQTNDQIFTGRPRTAAAVCTLYDCTDITFSPPNSYWKLMRQICATDLVNIKRVEAFRPVREAEARALVTAVMKDIVMEARIVTGISKTNDRKRGNKEMGDTSSADGHGNASMLKADVMQMGMKTHFLSGQKVVSIASNMSGTPENNVMQDITSVSLSASASKCDVMQDITRMGPGTADMKNMGVSAPGIVVSLRTKLLQASNNMIARMVLGKTLPESVASGSHIDRSLNLLDILDEVVHCLSIFNLGDLIPSIAWMDLQGVTRRSRAVARKLDIVLQGILDARRCVHLSSNISSPHEDDLLDVLLSISSKNAQISDDNIKAFILDMFIGGTDTSAYTIEWALTELLANPSAMKAAQEEIDKVVGKERTVCEADLAHLSYLKAVVNETMRLHPIIPLLIPHEATQQCKILGFDVPTKTQAYVNVWAVGRDASTWDEPLVFKPERFLNSDMSVEGKSFELIPFGAGRRGCPGWKLGLLNVQLHLASLLQGFQWCAPPDFDIQEKFGIMTTKAVPLAALATPKLPTHLYNIVA